MDYQLIEDEKNFLISRLFSLAGSILLIIGAVISVVVAYQAYMRLLEDKL